MLELCAGSAVLPAVYANPELQAPDGAVLISPDVWVDDIAMALMVHSRAHHARDADWEGTVEQDGALAEHGVIVLAFTAGSITRDPDGYSAGSSGPIGRHLPAAGSDRRCGWSPRG